jgi:tetratricopeptide (TPR) repeat protein
MDPTMGPTEGERHLSIAGYYITAGELTQDDAERRAAYAKAFEHAQRAVALMPDSAEAHFLVFGSEGRLAQMDGLATATLKLAALNRQLDEVLRLDPNHANALAARGGMLMKLPRLLGGDSQKGLEYLERAVSLDDESVGKRLELAEAYHMVGREGDARRVADDALAAAEQREKPAEVANCKRFIAELAEACPSCALASVGR